MSQLLLRWLLLFEIIIVINTTANAQNLVPDTTSSAAIKTAYSLYNASISEQFHLLEGKEYKDYERPFEEGHPYFVTTAWSKGSVNYDGNNYTNVSLLYDLVADQLIILATNKVSKINLQKEKVSGFSLLDHSFVNMTVDSLRSSEMTPGFYDLLVKGKTALVAKRSKEIQTYVTRTIELKAYKKDVYYIRKDGVFSQIHSKKSLLNLFADKRKEVSQFIKHNSLNFRKDTENTLIAIAEYYNQLTK